MPDDPAEHARDFARRYALDLDYVVTRRMVELVIPEHQIGARDPEHGIDCAAFIPHEGGGGGNSPDGRINLDSGILNHDLFQHLDPEAAGAYAGERLRHRVDAGLAHEYEEVRGGGDHAYAVEHAPDTELPISPEARGLARILRDAERRARRAPSLPP